MAHSEWFSKTLGERLFLARRRMGWSLRDAEKASGVSATTICRIENEVGEPSFWNILALSRAYDRVDLSELVSGLEVKK